MTQTMKKSKKTSVTSIQRKMSKKTSVTSIQWTTAQTPKLKKTGVTAIHRNKTKQFLSAIQKKKT